MEGTPYQASVPSVDQQIIALCDQRKLQEALSILHGQEGKAGLSAYVCLIQSCSKMVALREARYLHFYATECGLDEDLFLSNMIMRMHDKCGSLADAKAFFEKLPSRNIVSWNMIIGAHSSRGQMELALQLLSNMLKEDKVSPDKVTCITVLTVCSSLLSFTDISLIYELILVLKVENDVTIGNVLINAYGHWGSLAEAFTVFDKMPTKSSVSWSTLIACCAVPGKETFSLNLFQKMHLHDVPRSKATYIGTLNACEELSSILQGMLVHFEMAENSLEADVMLASKLIKMYGRCRSLADGFCVFESVRLKQDVFCWTVMIGSCIQRGHHKSGMQLFQEMLQEEVKPNNVTFVTLLGACTSPEALFDGRMVRDCLLDSDIIGDIILNNALLTMYQKCGSFSEAEELFYAMPKRDVISYTAMIAAYAEQKRGYEALFLFEKMCRIGIKADRFIYSGILDACASIASLMKGRALHHVVVEAQLECDGIIGNTLVSLYGECGVVEDALNVFWTCSERDWFAWSAIIAAHGNHGHSKEAFVLFYKMQQQGLKPTIITFVSIFSACSHVGLLKEGLGYFISMAKDHAIIPVAEHYVCLIDLISRAGCIHGAKEFMDRIPVQPNALMWNTLLGACRVHGILERGYLVGKHVFEVNPRYDAAYVMLSNLYASAGFFDEVMAVRTALESCLMDEV